MELVTLISNLHVQDANGIRLDISKALDVLQWDYADVLLYVSKLDATNVKFEFYTSTQNELDDLTVGAPNSSWLKLGEATVTAEGYSLISLPTPVTNAFLRYLRWWVKPAGGNSKATVSVQMILRRKTF
ncbi:MAG: hypothetical protein HY909_09285 [Deltaproteobacteria bacterium]|nr:hypothetical protein [Deltaproteobacteria bacterium]